MSVESWTADANDPLGEVPPEIREDVRAALREILSGRRKLVELLGRWEAYEWLCRVVKGTKPPRRRKGVHDAEYNVALLLADERAPKGKKTGAIRDVAERFGRDPNSATRHLYRLKRRPLRADELAVFPMDATAPPQGDK